MKIIPETQTNGYSTERIDVCAQYPITYKVNYLNKSQGHNGASNMSWTKINYTH